MSKQDIEAFVEAEGRDKMVKEVRAKIDALGVEYLYLQFVSITGRICGKGIPADHWESVAEKGFQLVYGATVNLFMNRHGDYLGYGPEAQELVGIPEPDTFCQLAWDKRVARVFCTLFRNREERILCCVQCSCNRPGRNWRSNYWRHLDGNNDLSNPNDAWRNHL